MAIKHRPNQPNRFYAFQPERCSAFNYKILRGKIKYAFVAILVFITIVFSLKGRISYVQFDSAKWKNWTPSLESEWSLRWDMMNSLRNNYKLKGMNKTEVVKSLGKPTSRSDDKFIYSLGYTGRGINTGSLTIKFNNNHKVFEYSVWQG